ncbi:hypothetical protein HNI00_10085 [Thermoleptolyngbya oregonensis NK1-22]|uniref:Uncharacterized protein n=1 Tax=Thermoleptolyngbya oregonensis NK1-22 TaxID=2547457 RepID=A0AA96Y4U5_9CYAN|nr:hypothetical protein [Thermoleptolyngbya oregonensis]WOB43469.1 hypothetical protein HNI00_10085 [Thermoleptolyngbya oregonensis NK1-22]
MPHSALRSPLARVSALVLTTAGLLVLGLPTSSALASYRYRRVRTSDYEECTADLIGRGAAEAVAATACASAFHPREVSRCVAGIGGGETLVVSDVLGACRSVRRPEDLAQCFNQIVGDDETANLSSVLSHCRRSLLPNEFANCVVGIKNGSTLTTDRALATCIDAVDTPGRVVQ